MTDPLRDDVPTLKTGTVVSRYRVVRKLGEGQMGEVYETQRTTDGGHVALKVVRNMAGHDEPLRRFQREATLCAALRHRNVVPVIDYGVWEGKPFLAMPILRGTDLDALLTRVGALPPDVALYIALGSARGLDFAHKSSIVHRDFKPANVFLDHGDDQVVTPIVCDFGVAKALDASDGGITATGAVVGTPLYMAPEQLIDSKRVDARCDVWSLGMTLYQMLAGRTAFADVRTFAELLLAMREERIPALQSFAPWVQPSVARIVHAMLLPPERRLPTMGAVIEALERFVPADAKVTVDSLRSVPDEMKSRGATVAIVPMSADELSRPDLGGSSAAPTTQTSADPFIGRTLNDRYVVSAKIGSGGMGAVYEATDRLPASAAHGEVALKVMLVEPSLKDSEGIRRFLREAKAAGRIANPHVTAVLDTGVDAMTGSPYLVMERLRGNDLSGYIRQMGALEPEPVVSLFLHACDGLATAHALGIVHRDIKPSNLFVHEWSDGTVVLKICDFGIAKQLTGTDAPEVSAELTRTGGILGSPLYMSPEQAKSARNVDARSDVFSLSLSLHEALSGRRPWDGKSSMGEIIVAVCTEDVPPLTELAPWVAPELARTIHRGLMRDPAARFQTIADFAAALRPFGLGRPLKGAEVVGVRAERRSQARPPYPVESSASASASTHDPTSVTSSGLGGAGGRSRATAGIIGVAAVALVGAGVGFAVLRNRAVPTETPAGPAATAPTMSNTPLNPAPSASNTTTIVALPGEPVDAGLTPARSNAHAALPPRPNVTRPNVPPTSSPGTATSRPTAAPTASGVGRGGTATDLP
jgi:serine/threonine protein kinase